MPLLLFSSLLSFLLSFAFGFGSFAKQANKLLRVEPSISATKGSRQTQHSDRRTHRGFRSPAISSHSSYLGSAFCSGDRFETPLPLAPRSPFSGPQPPL